MPSRRLSPFRPFPGSSSVERCLTAAVVAAALAVEASAQLQFSELGRTLPSSGLGIWCRALGDVDGDGDLDMVCGFTGPTSQNRLCLNDGSGTFVDATATGMPVDSDVTSAVALGDVDGDGDLDIVFGNGQQNRLYLNDGSGTFTDATAVQMPFDNDVTLSVALGDVDVDGDLDLVCGNAANPGQQNRLYLNDGLGTFSDATASRLPADGDATTSVALGDVDGDGDLDLVLGNRGQGQRSRLYRNSGNGTFVDVTAAQLPLDTVPTGSMALGDVDGDGDLDLAVGKRAVLVVTSPLPFLYAYDVGQQNRLLLNDGSGTFTDVTSSHMPSDAEDTAALVFGDVDADGDLDLVAGNWAVRTIVTPFPLGQTQTSYHAQPDRCYLNDGTGAFAAALPRLPVIADMTSSVALGDVDGDEDLDVVCTSGFRGQLYFNLLRQLDAPSPPAIGQSYQLDVHARYGPPRLFDVALPFLSLAPASIPLPPYGTLGIDPNLSYALPPLLVPQPAGVGSVFVSVPNDPGFVGLHVYLQAVLVQYPVQSRLTNTVRAVVQ